MIDRSSSLFLHPSIPFCAGNFFSVGRLFLSLCVRLPPIVSPMGHRTLLEETTSRGTLEERREGDSTSGGFALQFLSLARPCIMKQRIGERARWRGRDKGAGCNPFKSYRYGIHRWRRMFWKYFWKLSMIIVRFRLIFGDMTFY